MAAAPGGVVDQAQRLVSCARLLPADEAAKALEQVANIVSAAQADILIGAEHRGELSDSGCATVRTFAATILRRSVHDASGLARVAQHLVELPKLAAAYRTGQASTATLRVVVDQLHACGLGALQANEDQLVALATHAGPATRQTQQHRQPRRYRQPRRRRQRRRWGWAGAGTQLRRTAGHRVGGPAPDLPARARTAATATVDLPTLLGLPGHGQAILSRFGLIPTTTAAALCCDALVRLVLTHGHRVLTVGRAHRLVRTANAPRSPRSTPPVCCRVRSGSPTATCATCGGGTWADHRPGPASAPVPGPPPLAARPRRLGRNALPHRHLGLDRTRPRTTTRPRTPTRHVIA
jgi:hypothetical protein